MTLDTFFHDKKGVNHSQKMTLIVDGRGNYEELCWQYYLIQVLQNLAHLGWVFDVHIVSSGSKNNPFFSYSAFQSPHIKLHPILVSRHKGIFTIQMCFKLFSFFRKNNNQTVHLMLSKYNYFGVFASVLSGNRGKIIVSEPNLTRTKRDYPSLFRLSMIRFLNRFVECVVVESRSLFYHLQKNGIDTRKIQVIYRGIDTDLFKPPTSYSRALNRLGLGILPTAFVMISIGIRESDDLMLLSALARITTQLPNSWHLIIVSESDTYTRCVRDQIKVFDLTSHVLVVESPLERINLLGISDIGLSLSSTVECSGFILEAMGCGVPMIVADIGSNQEIVLNEKCGLVILGVDPIVLSGAILKLYHDFKGRIQFSELSRERVMYCFGLNAMLQSLSRLYAGCVKPPESNVQK